MTEAGHPETAEEIQAVVRTSEWQAYARRYEHALAKGDVLAAHRTVEAIRTRFGDRLAEGLAEWEAEE